MNAASSPNTPPAEGTRDEKNISAAGRRIFTKSNWLLARRCSLISKNRIYLSIHKDAAHVREILTQRVNNDNSIDYRR